ncbi:uncharacterized protein [Littorina saxatilis]|uniref:uncharacterized protein n=1 Tax=Littorina saxatilis TaxID=31220 RepID=UPI0038B55679
MEFNFTSWAKNLPQPVIEVLEKEEFTSLSALKYAGEKDLESLKLKRGHIVELKAAVADLQQKYGGGPLRAADQVAPLQGLLGNMAIQSASPGETYLRIVDFVPASMAVEEEVTLGGGVTLKLANKPKLEKVSPCHWIVANAKIMAKLMNTVDFDHEAYLCYTEMVGELGARFSWQSVLLYDDEYRKRQSTSGFAWGTPNPHLSTVILCERAQQVPGNKSGKATTGSGGIRRPVGPSGKEVCLQYTNKGTCLYGSRCRFEHVCDTCGKEHPGKDHQATANTSA